MEEKDVIEILRHYRHDLLNHLQIIQGYSSMGKTDKVNAKIAEYLQLLDEERKLVNLNVPLFALSLIQFDSLHTNFLLTYHIHTENKDLKHIDEALVSSTSQLMNEIKDMADETELYEVCLQMCEVSSSSMIELKLNVNGNLPNIEKLMKNIESMELVIETHQDSDGIVCLVNIPY
ncbi:stage 0 sporulation protein B (sporulation initiation phosphotransferase) [Virgibacillus subterraneus]|uniref:Stage 0 sporulation protein B (Sporulation initiation phosphotransferase) n=2 Tax=Virgibacillus TaxID=84406 RepID=A0A1H1B3J2_9BACI|nr:MULTISPECIES: Spo0B domain-containing protein [Virgibacillus]SDQ46509.1 stage 0 sporulation protein B (sporulation initiation phosphotransferase) [Virgibacillus salinus]SEQ14898.1 stage 0 sporulation protein B (sporulation initiation phosphotransferase) [Virgibacillus subterraneus]